MSKIKSKSDGPNDQKKSAAWVMRTLFILALSGTAIVSIVGGIVYWQFSKDLPKIVTVQDYRPPVATRILGGNGKEEELLGEFFHENERRYLVPPDQIPEVVIQAFISAEDDQFFNHPGINLASIIRAAIANFRAGHTVQGGSTITQQVAKMLLLDSRRVYTRKIREMILASRFERNLSKREILYLYLNQIYLGNGAYGIQAAAKAYFRKDAATLNFAEAALLAGMPQAPSEFNPYKNPRKAKERQVYVLGQMLKNGYLNSEQYEEAKNQPLRIFGEENVNTKYAAHYVEYVRRYLLEKYGEKVLYGGGLTVSVPVTRELSLAANHSLKEGLRALDKRMGYRGPIKRAKPAEIEAVQRELKLKLIEKKLGYLVFLPDGKIDALEAMREAGVQSESQLLDVGEYYQAVVVNVDDKTKIAEVTLGTVPASLPMEQMKWAKSYQEAPGWRPDPTVPSKVLTKGDVVLVKYLGVPEAGPDKTPQVSLDQEPQVEGAILSLDTQTGIVLAMDGGYDFTRSQFNRAVQAQRQPGSAFKPIIYSAGLEYGYTPATIIVDSPLVLDEDSETGKWKPTNFEEKFYGDTTYRQSLIKSRNIPTIKILQTIQIQNLINYAKRLGMEGNFSPDLSISLGSSTTTLLELTKVYSLFPRLGRKVEPIFVTQVKDREGKVLEETVPKPLPTEIKLPPAPVPSPVAEQPITDSPNPAPSPTALPRVALPTYPLPNDPDQILDPRVAFVMTHLMKEVVNYGTGFEAKALGRPAAGKTGTTNDYLDAWFMGFTPHVTTGVWVGFDNQKPMGSGETGAKAALPIWLNFMKEAVKPYPPDADFAVPPGVVFAHIDPTSGKLAPSNSSRSIREAFVDGTQPKDNINPADASASESQSEFFKEDVQ